MVGIIHFSFSLKGENITYRSDIDVLPQKLVKQNYALFNRKGPIISTRQIDLKIFTTAYYTLLNIAYVYVGNSNKKMYKLNNRFLSNIVVSLKKILFLIHILIKLDRHFQ